MDLISMFGHRYVVTWDESWDAETPENRAEFRAKNEEWWYYEIKGRCGTVYPYNEAMVAVTLPTRAAHRLMRFMGQELVRFQHADNAMSFKADVKHAAAIVQFIKPKRRRQLTAEQKAALAARLVPYRFKSPKLTQITRSSDAESAPLSPGVTS